MKRSLKYLKSIKNTTNKYTVPMPAQNLRKTATHFRNEADKIGTKGIGWNSAENLVWIIKRKWKNTFKRPSKISRINSADLTSPILGFPNKYRDLFHQTREQYFNRYRSETLGISENVLKELEILLGYVKQCIFQQTNEEKAMKFTTLAHQILKTYRRTQRHQRKTGYRRHHTAKCQGVDRFSEGFKPISLRR